MSTNLTEEELRQAAAEAGVSPQELRLALAQRDHMEAGGGTGALARSPLGPPTRGQTARHVEGRLPLRHDAALLAVRRSIEQQVGKQGHGQGELEADVVDEDAGLTYRLRSRPDAGGALVRIDIDPSQGKGTQALATTGVAGITLTMLALGLLFNATLLWLSGVGVGLLGALLVMRSAMSLRRAVASAQATAAHALMEVEDKAALIALPPPPRR